MEWAPQALVIILAVALAIFLILAIALMIMLIKITRQIKRVTTTAEKTAVAAENFFTTVMRMVSPAVIGSAILEVIKKSTKGKK